MLVPVLVIETHALFVPLSHQIRNPKSKIECSPVSILNSQLHVRRRAPVVCGARNAMSALDLRHVRRFFARFKKPSRFQRSNRRNAGCHRTAGYQPAMSAKREHLSCGSPHGVRAKHPSPVMPPAPRAPVGSVLLPKCRCCGYVPPVRAGGSAFVLPTTDNDLSKNPIVTAPGSDLANADS